MFIELEKVSFLLNKEYVLSDINVDIKENLCYGFTGRNGSGKTMLLRAAAGFIDTEGTVRYNGRIRKKGEFISNTGIIIGETDFIPFFSGYENLKALSQISGKADEKRIYEVLELTGLNELQIKELLKQKDSLETQQIVFLIERISYYIKEMKFATNQHLWLEVAMIDLSNMAENSKLIDIQNRLIALESGMLVGTHMQAVQPNVTRPAPIQPTSVTPNEDKKEPTLIKKVVKDDVEEFTPPPMSKKPDGKDIISMWQCLLGNIKSASANALLKLATPVKISKEETIITFKNENLVSQILNTNKKQALTDAVDALFSQTNSNVVVRLAQSGDLIQSEIVQNKHLQEEKKEEKTQIIKQEKTLDEKQEKKKVQSQNDSIKSDQEKMIVDLFDGKYVE